jgi:NADPH:quinone reductase-like Zn-dependent oxidoreductase
MPAEATFEEAGAVCDGALIAMSCLRGAHPLKGRSILIYGASGSIGTAAVQLTKHFEADVAAVCNTKSVELVRSLGANDVIDYTREDFTGGSRRWDVIIDTAGRRPLSQLRRALTRKGTLVIVGGDGGGRWTGGFFRGMLRAPVVSLFVGQRLRGLATKIEKQDLLALGELIASGAVKPVIDRTFPLVEAPDAIRYLEEGHPAGKVVITV